MFDDDKISYLKIMLAVCGGVLLANAIQLTFGLLVIDAAVDSQVNSISNQVSSATQQMREISANSKRDAAKSAAQQRIANEAQRRESDLGEKLARECGEYQQFYRDNSS
ncbi:MAG: hypothetical protein MUO51_09460, partial [Woeseiaceae bacterium]|nr:hypothetical protein [Woeseiaceae bacterium]